MVLTEMEVRLEQKCYPDCRKDPVITLTQDSLDAVAFGNRILLMEPGQIVL